MRTCKHGHLTGESECVVCKRLRNRRYEKSHRAYLSAEQTKRRKKDKVKARMERYGQSAELYYLLFALQDGQCAICGTTSQSFVVDHDHSSGRVRGLLCGHCNVWLGQIRENREKLRRALDYLTAPPASYLRVPEHTGVKVEAGRKGGLARWAGHVKKGDLCKSTK
jgi:hypothetical protein